MNLTESVQVMKAITNFYSQFMVNENMVKAWHSVLIDYDFNLVMNNLKNHVIMSNYPPTVSSLVKHVDLHKTGAYIKIGEGTLERQRKDAEKLIEQYERDGYLNIEKG